MTSGLAEPNKTPVGVDGAILVHGYSATALTYYAKLPQMLADEGIPTNQIALSAFISLDDEVSCDDIAQGLEAQVSALERAGLNLQKSKIAIITH